MLQELARFIGLILQMLRAYLRILIDHSNDWGGLFL